MEEGGRIRFKSGYSINAAKIADVIMILINDEGQTKLFKESILPNLTPGKYLAFTSGYSIHFEQIITPEDVNVFMIAPKGPGHTVRSQFKEGKGVPCLVAVHQDPSGNTKEILRWLMPQQLEVQEQVYLKRHSKMK